MGTNHAYQRSSRTRMTCQGYMNGPRRNGLMRDFLIIMIIMGWMCTSLGLYPVKIVYSGEMTEDIQRMQEQLNNQVMSKPFSVADEVQVRAYIEGAQKRGELPQPYTGKNWKPGYTCVNLRPYSYQEYLSCRYYHFYYGHYYR
jgi:hypothetical protein